jgi:hypothetical protein
LDRYGHLLPVDQIAVGSRIDQQVFGGLSNICLTKQAETRQNNINHERKEIVVNINKR